MWFDYRVLLLSRRVRRLIRTEQPKRNTRETRLMDLDSQFVAERRLELKDVDMYRKYCLRFDRFGPVEDCGLTQLDMQRSPPLFAELVPSGHNSRIERFSTAPSTDENRIPCPRTIKSAKLLRWEWETTLSCWKMVASYKKLNS